LSGRAHWTGAASEGIASEGNASEGNASEWAATFAKQKTTIGPIDTKETHTLNINMVNGPDLFAPPHLGGV
jgi:hypothetical protein